MKMMCVAADPKKFDQGKHLLVDIRKNNGNKSSVFVEIAVNSKAARVQDYIFDEAPEDATETLQQIFKAVITQCEKDMKKTEIECLVLHTGIQHTKIGPILTCWELHPNSEHKISSGSSLGLSSN